MSNRRAAFFAAMALRSGQKSDRVVAAEPGWRIPLTPLTDPESSAIRDGLNDQDDRAGLIQALASIHSEIER